MKHSLVTLLVFLAFPTLALLGQQTVSNRKEMRDNGIKRIIEVRYQYVDGAPESEGTQWGYHEYDERGNHIVNGRYAAGGGTPAGHPMYLRVYDEADRPIKRIWYCNRTQKNPEGSVCLVFENYQLDEYGNVAEENGYTPEGQFVARVTFKRDPQGRPLERSDYVENDEAQQKRYVYEYDDDAGSVITTTFDHAGRLMNKTVARHRYDDSRNIIETRHYDARGKPTGRVTHRYDEAGLKVETVEFDPNNMPFRMKRFQYEFH